MTLHFYLRYSTKFGQAIFVSGNTPALGNDDGTNGLALTYLNDQLWHGSVEIDAKDREVPVCYRYILKDEDGALYTEFGNDRLVEPQKSKASKIVVYDTWNYAGEYENAFFTAPFTDVLLKRNGVKETTSKKNAKATHQFKVKAPVLKQDEMICISGSGVVFNDWDKEKVLLLSKKDNWWTIELDLGNAVFPQGYKYGIYNSTDKRFTRFEDGNNRVLLSEDGADAFTILHDGFAKLNNVNWKAAGVAIPVFSLRSKKSFGTGEFADLNLLVD
ncbi:MAG: carbohydrate-binding module family 20 domain-containing protein, partial [Ferruginibacter sp.]